MSGPGEITIAHAQADVRRVHRGGSMGPLVSGAVWLVATALMTWASPPAAMWALFVGGALIFPISTLLLRARGGPASLPPGHPSSALAFESAMVAPAGTLLAIVVGIFGPDRFFPAATLMIGVHYLVFVSLYGLRLYLALALVLTAIGVLGLFAVPQLGFWAGWATGAALLAFVLPLDRASRPAREPAAVA
ncbi:DUF7010 family protein [Microbacterium paludicola]|uniref:Uncharacterized protein n=1 Tax=Microbacterium paludicola TaxID=300019 RepID=A0A4Y9FYD2_9MICO|nr:hypothetical protein [Microbacterium paludicola]MBF0815602.1 hypothetical protein [Microbacterium paludicola]TFU33658.1 hypothetical protein E4U02_04180 [Microbacterium paludicola]